MFWHFTREPRYYSAVDEIREAIGPEKACGPGAMRGPRSIRERGQADPTLNNPLGKLPGSVWTIATEPLRVPDELGIDHFAAFPTEFPRRIIQGWSPREVCTVCGEGRRPVRATAELETKQWAREQQSDRVAGRSGEVLQRSTLGYAATDRAATITGYACACPDTSAPATPGVVLDPFGGTGTTALVASVLGRHGISVDLSRDYCRLAEWRTSDPGQRAKAARVEAPPPVLDGQLALFPHGGRNHG